MTGRRLALTLLAGLLVLATAPAAGAAVSDGSPGDPLWQYQWGPQQVDADQSWDTSTGSGATLAIVDSGVDLDHPDLQANIVGGYDAIDGSGGGDWEGGEPHGTHVAGIAAAVADNGEGIAGVAPDAGILAVRVLDDSGSGSFEDIAEGIRWSVDNGADAINLSLGALPGVQALVITGLITDVYDAIQYANDNGVVVVAAAGNEAFPLCEEPAFDHGALCVVATDKREAQAWYSDGAIKPDLLSVAAPGGAGLFVLCYEEIVSTVPPGTGGDYCGYPAEQTYDEYAGTSMAAPHVSGVVGLLAAQGCTRSQILDAITSTARTPVTGEPRGVWDPAYGYGIVDADDALAAGLCSGSTSDGDTSTSTNSAPSALNDSVSAASFTWTTFDVLANDEDPDGDALTITDVSKPANGNVRTDGATVTYRSRRGFTGTDTFTYTVSDGNGGTDTATVTVTVE